MAWGVDYLGSGGAGLLIATEKLMSEEKSEETEQQTGSVPLVTANTSRKIKAKGQQKKNPHVTLFGEQEVKILVQPQPL